ncbi:MAG: DNA topoisomerase I, partial [Thaumarchaeota archaeon]|nr:DNA topoisomerase I [Nitrososphaerota archaeon]
VIHAPENMWIASWTDKLSDKVKYVWLHDSSALRQERDKGKYDKARDLDRHIDRVRAFISKSMGSKDQKTRKMATVCFLIDKLAMRVGDEKDEDEADTVGASTLRVEHLKFQENKIDFDFYGKDFVRWQKTLEIQPQDRAAIDNLKEFCKGKKPDGLIFDGITSRHVNEFLGKASKGLTAKVFRTFHATNAVKSYLQSHNHFSEETPEYEKLFEAKMANLEAAVKCNHKRTPPKTFEQSLQKKEEKLKQLTQSDPKTEKQKEKLEERIAKMKRQIEFTKMTREYNLNTSLRNYIDPRVFKNWADNAGLDWKLLYTSTLQRKMAWVAATGARTKVETPHPAMDEKRP